MPDKAKLKRRRTQPQRDKARNRREEQAEAEAESGRRLAQSQRDKARSRRETQEEITRIAVAVQRQLALVRQPSSPAAKPEVHTSTVSLITIMEKRSAEFMQNIARLFNDPRYSDATVVIYGKSLPVHKCLSARKANIWKRHFRTRLLREAQGCSRTTMVARPPTGGSLSTCTQVIIRTIYHTTLRMTLRC